MGCVSLALLAAAVAPSAAGAALPNGRAYEQVSPADKSYATLMTNGGARQTAANGEAAVFGSSIAFADSPASPILVTYRARRTPTGWVTQGITPPRLPVPGPPVASGGQYPAITPNLDAGVVYNDEPDLTDNAPPDVRNLYVRDLITGAYRLVTTRAPVRPLFYDPGFADASEDLGHVLFESFAALTPDAPPFVTNLYESVNGTLRYVGLLPDGTPMSGGSISGSTQDFSLQRPKRRTISEDGSRIFLSDLGTSQLYLREDGETVHVSASQRTPADPNGTRPATFQTATPDGSQVFFTSQEQLTDDATTGADSSGTDLYRYDVESGELTDLSVDTNPADPIGAQVQGVVGVSDSGDRVYFVALGQLEPGRGTAGSPNLYVWSPSGVRFVATLDGADAGYWTEGYRPINEALTPDGRHVVLASFAELTDDPNGGFRQVYVYDDESGSITCVSCPPDWSAATGNATTRRQILDSPSDNDTLPLQNLPLNISDDGRRVYFESPDALLRSDTNGRFDVYQYEEGQLSLISTGQSSSNSHYLGMSTSGDDVMFYTRERLVPTDRDDLIDVYDARVGGGFPLPPPPPVPCDGDDCQGPPTPPPAAPIVGSVTFGEAVDEDEPEVTPPSRITLGKATARGARFSVRVEVPAAGRIVGRGGSVATVSKVAPRAGSYTLTFRLKRRARRALQRRGLRARVAIVYRRAGTGGVSRSRAVVRLTVQKPKKATRDGRRNAR